MSLSEIKEALRVYHDRIWPEDVAPLEWSGLQALFPELELAPEVTSRWPEASPSGSRPGVYFIFGSGLRLLYVGKASMKSNIGARLSSHFKYDGSPARGCLVVGNWSEQPRCIATVPLPDEMAYQAPALEEYLIAQLSPPVNVQGKRRKD